MLTERLDHHRGRGQQHITVKHVTVNADQAVVAENVTTALPALQANAPVAIEQILQPSGWDREGAETEMSDNPMHRCNAAPRCRAKSKRTGLPCRSPAVKGYRVCRMHGARGGAPEGKRNGNFRHGGRTKEAIGASRYINALARLLREGN